MNTYKQCTRCIMDNSADPFIEFDEKGHCNYCNEAIDNLNKYYFPNCNDSSRLNLLLEKIKKEGVGKNYDCMMGISGGLDSSYLAYLGSMKWGLRILAFHVDDGYDTEISKRNIKRLADLPNVTMHTIIPDAKQFNELTRAFLFAGVPNIALPQDNILFAELLKEAKKYHITAFLSGSNLSLESILQRGNTHPNYDDTNIKDIFRKHGRGSINKLHFLSPLKRDVYHYINHITTYRCLDLISYNRESAITELHDQIGFEYYGSKHLENDLTKFIQLYWFPHKFKVDKRKSHLSSMIVSGQMTREQALNEIQKPLYDEKDMEDTIDMILKRLDISKQDFDLIMNSPIHQHTEYKTSHYYDRKEKLRHFLNYKTREVQ